MAAGLNAFEDRQHVHGVEDVAHDDVVELLVQHERFGVGADEVQMRMFGGGDGDHRGTDLDADAVGRFYRVQKMAGLASNLQNAFAGFDDVA